MGGLKAKMQLSGLNEYLERIQRAGRDVDDLAKEAVKESAKPIFEDISKWAEKHKRTGAVLEGVTLSEVEQTAGKISVEVGISSEKSKQAWHAAFVEYGTPKVAPDPGIWPAFKNNRAKVKKIQKTILEKGGIPVD